MQLAEKLRKLAKNYGDQNRALTTSKGIAGRSKLLAAENVLLQAALDYSQTLSELQQLHAEVSRKKA